MYRKFCGEAPHIILPSSPPHLKHLLFHFWLQKENCLVGNLAVLGNVASLTAVVARLGELVGSLVTVLGDVAALTARVTLHGVGLAVLGKVVRAATLVAQSGLTAGSGLSLSWLGGSGWSSSLVFGALSGDVAKFGAVVTLGTLRAVGAVALHVTNVTAGVTLLSVSGFWLRAGRRLVAGLATVVAQSLGLLAVVSNVAGLAALVTGFREHFVLEVV